MMELNAQVAAVVTAVVAAVAGLLTSRFGKKGDRENALIDQLQEERTMIANRLSALESQVSDLQKEVAVLKSKDAKWAVHATRLEAQVVDLGGVPVERPAALREDA